MTKTKTKTETQTRAATAEAAEQAPAVHPDQIKAAGRAAALAMRQLAALTAGASLEAQQAALTALLTKNGVMAALTQVVTAARPDVAAYDDLSTDRAAAALDEAGHALTEAREELDYAHNLIMPMVG